MFLLLLFRKRLFVLALLRLLLLDDLYLLLGLGTFFLHGL